MTGLFAFLKLELSLNRNGSYVPGTGSFQNGRTDPSGLSLRSISHTKPIALTPSSLTYLEKFLEGFVGLVFPVQPLLFRDLLLGPKVHSRVYLRRRYRKIPHHNSVGRWEGRALPSLSLCHQGHAYNECRDCPRLGCVWMGA